MNSQLDLDTLERLKIAINVTKIRLDATCNRINKPYLKRVYELLSDIYAQKISKDDVSSVPDMAE